MAEASEKMELYFSRIDMQLKKAYDCADKARKKCLDPEPRVDIFLAKNMAERVEGLISAVAPQLVGSGMTDRIQELEKKYGALDWRVALVIAEEVAKEKFCKFKTTLEAMEVGIRAGFAYHTVGIVAAPLEGFIELVIKKKKNGNEYFAAKYAGPIRGAGGTAASVSVIIADYVRKKMGYDTYDPDESEVCRYVTELEDYHERVTNLQYHASSDEIKFLARNFPVEIDGDPTEKIEVSNYKDLPRVETNRIRGGVCLVVSMIALKAPKIWKELSKWGKDFDLDWTFLESFIKMQKEKKSTQKEGDTKKGIRPDFTYMSDLVAGRPVLTYPLRKGGLRLRYGRTRTSGYSATAIHPALSILLNKYIATGTQLKTERPGKAAAVTFCDQIEGPIILNSSGDVLRVETEAEAKALQHDVKEILFMGDILFSYGDFSDRAHLLAPAGYCEEWYVQELEKATVNYFGCLDFQKLSRSCEIPLERINKIIENIHFNPSADTVIKLSQFLNIPLHPYYTYYWNCIAQIELIEISQWLAKSTIKQDENGKKIVASFNKKIKRSLELAGVPHINAANEYIVFENGDAEALVAIFGLEKEPISHTIEQESKNNPELQAIELLNLASKIQQRDKCGTFIGARMGRPEKAKMRKLTGGPQVLFPVGEEGGRLRSFQESMQQGKVSGEFPDFYCKTCAKKTVFPVCETCNEKTEQRFFCDTCGELTSANCPHGIPKSYVKKEIDISYYFNSCLKMLSLKTYPDLIKGIKGTSNKGHIPEHLAKGILRAKNDIYVNKDGTTRYDMTELPITHFKPKEIRTSIEKLHELGYEKDIHGKPLVDKEQICELIAQDIILPSGKESLDESADEILFRISKFIDELLENFYGMEPFYRLEKKDDIIGHLVIGIAPHISAGIVGRIIGFSETLGMFAHPLFHAAMRRDADGDEAGIILMMDGLLNFSRTFLPDRRGSRTMDSPLVLTSRLVPAEVDDMVLKLDVAWHYPLELYEASLLYKMPWDVKVEQLGSRLGTERQYEGLGFTHDTYSINSGITCSAYKTLPSMEEKIKGQMDIAEKVWAVDVDDVARLVIEKHLLKDIKGNLRKFSTQQFRCVKCNYKYRRPPLAGKCLRCSGRIIFTVSEGSVLKYLEPSMSLTRKYNIPAYLKQSLDLTKRRIEGVFGKEKERQQGLGAWFG